MADAAPLGVAFPIHPPKVRYFATGWKAQMWIWAALLRAEVVLQFGRSGLGLLGKIGEPLIHIGVLVTWHWLNRAVPVYGTSIVLFISTGIYPMFLFIHLSSAFRPITRSRREMLPGITNLDLMIIKATVFVGTYVVSGFVLFGIFYYFVTPWALPFRIDRAALALLTAATLGVGMAFINAVFSKVIEAWHFVWIGLSRSLILFGGILYVPDFLPPYLRDYMKWNPSLQMVELYRQGFYPGYPTLIFMPYYLFMVALALVAIGICLERSTRDVLHRLHFASVA